MAHPRPMDVLRDRAEKTLNDTTTMLGSVRQSHAHETNRLAQLQTYAQEYRQQLQETIVDSGVSIMTLRAHHNFLTSLDSVVAQQIRKVNNTQHSVENALNIWKKDRQRLNAFDTLKSRAEAQRLLQENRLDQKLMDEFAQRASQRNR